MIPKPKRVTRSKRRKQTETKRLMKEALRVHSLYIRNRDGWKCVLCGRKGKGNEIHNGHLIKRGKKSTLFDNANCNALCAGCNQQDNYYHEPYVNWFILKYGVEKYQDLIRVAAIPKQWKPYELQEIIDRCKQ